MIQADDFISAAKVLGFATWTGVPCSYLTPLVNRVIADPEMIYISSANEGDAVATASGAVLGGRPAVAMMQNSGLGNAVSPLSSLNWVFRIPVLLVVTLRGEPGLPDEPQHELMGQITGNLLDQLQIPWDWFPRSSLDIEGALTVASWHMNKTARPYAFIMRKGSVAPGEAPHTWKPPARPAADSKALATGQEPQLTRQQALQCIVENTPEEETVVIGTTGYTGRELLAVADRPNQLYMVGSMGCASSFGLGLSLAQPAKRIVVIDGDGAALMRMGNFATAGAYANSNFCHVVLDNAMHESTGGQPTVSAAINFAAVARACGYARVNEAHSSEALAASLDCRQGPAMVHLRTLPGVPQHLPRPALKPPEVCRRLMSHLGVESLGQAL